MPSSVGVSWLEVVKCNVIKVYRLYLKCCCGSTVIKMPCGSTYIAKKPAKAGRCLF